MFLSVPMAGTHFVAQAGLKLRYQPASASQVLGLQACTTTAYLYFEVLKQGLLYIKVMGMREMGKGKSFGI